MRIGIFTLLITSILFVTTENSEAQIWKKLKNKTKQKVEDRITDKISDKLAEVIVGKMTEKFDLESNPYRGGNKISKPDNLPAEYSFDWNYQLKMTSTSNSEQAITFDYKLPESGSYFGYSTEQSQEMFSVVDQENEVIVSYMEEDEKSFALSHSYPSQMVENNMYTPGAADDVEITELAEKDFLGYTAKGYKIDTPESEMIVYVTEKAGVSFSGMAGLPNQGIPQTFTNNLDEMKDTLMLYMKFTNKNNDDVMEMECIGLKKESFKKKNADYNFL